MQASGSRIVALVFFFTCVYELPNAASSPSPMTRERLVPLIVAVALFMENMDSTVIATSLPAIAADIGSSPLELKLAITSYLLALAIFIPASGWMADRFGARTIFRTAIAVFMIGSIGCALSHSLWHFVIARFLQGTRGAMMSPVGRLVLIRTVGKHKLIGAMAAPIIDLTLFRLATYRAGVAGGFIFRVGAGALPFLLPLLMQLGFGMTPFQSGLVTLSTPVGAMMMKSAVPPILRRAGFRNVLTWDALVAPVLLAARAALTPAPPGPVMIALLLPGGFFPPLHVTSVHVIA